MRSRYVLPLLYLVLVALSLGLRVQGLLFILIAPQALMKLLVESALDKQFGDILYVQIAVGVLLLFVIGAIIDKLATRLVEAP